MAKSAPSYCAELVRRQDRERYLTALFAPAGRREDLFALYAFNLEVAKTNEMVSEPLLGEIRLQWWREALDELYGGRVRRHAVVEALARAVERHGLTRGHFERLLGARAFDLKGRAPESLVDLEAYAEGTSACLMWLALEVLGAGGPETAEAGRRLGLAWALAGLARAVPFHARQKRLYLPADLSEAAGLDGSALFALRGSGAVCQVVEALATQAAAHLGALDALGRGLPKAARPLLLLAPLARRHLRVLRRAGHDPFDPRVQRPAAGAAWRLAWAALTGYR